MVVVADSHAVVWYLQGSKRLSPTAHEALREAERTSGFVISVVTLIDLWYVSQTTGRVSEEDLRRLTDHLTSSDAVSLERVGLAVAEAATTIPRALLADPWDRLIVATAKVLDVPLVTRDAQIQTAQLVHTTVVG